MFSVLCENRHKSQIKSISNVKLQSGQQLHSINLQLILYSQKKNFPCTISCKCTKLVYLIQHFGSGPKRVVQFTYVIIMFSRLDQVRPWDCLPRKLLPFHCSAVCLEVNPAAETHHQCRSGVFGWVDINLCELLSFLLHLF